jgi:hypothetical protein
MRASILIWVPVLFVCGCGSKSTPTPAMMTDGGDMIDVPDGRATLGEGGAKQLSGIGGPCVTRDDCKTAYCFSDMQDPGWRNGYCVQACGGGMGPSGPSPVNCPMGAACTTLDTFDGICYLTCNSDADCRASEGYYCLDATPKLKAGGPKVCYAKNSPPGCNVNSDCPAALPKCMGGDPDGGGFFPMGTCSM